MILFGEFVKGYNEGINSTNKDSLRKFGRLWWARKSTLTRSVLPTRRPCVLHGPVSGSIGTGTPLAGALGVTFLNGFLTSL